MNTIARNERSLYLARSSPLGGQTLKLLPFLCSAISILAGAGMLGATQLRAQPPEFEVSTVKPNHGDGDRSPSRYPILHNGIFNAENVSLKTLLEVAYGLSRIRITGPSWIDSDRFDLAAKAPEGALDSELRPLLQSLIKDRFHVEIHRETKEMPVYHMTPAKSGLKLQPFDPARPPVMPPNKGGSLLIGVGTTSQIADMLALATGGPVVDRTNVPGLFRYMLVYAPILPQATAGSGVDLGLSDLFVAVQEQLGIKLISTREPIEILVVDHAERIPTQN